MKTLDSCNTKRVGALKESQSAFFGLIGEADFYRPELYGFEVDLTGSVVMPEFKPGNISESRSCHKAIHDTAA